jgi:hypothetical protein
MFQPMQELLAYVCSHGFVAYVMASGNLDFARVAAGCGYDLPPERVIGGGLRTRLEYRQGRADLVNLADYTMPAQREGKASAVHRHLGRRPVLAAGNSASDLALLHYTAGGPGRRLTLLLHDDPRTSHDGPPHDSSPHDSHQGQVSLEIPLSTMPVPLSAADLPRGGLVVNLQRDFRQLFPV